MAQTIKDKIIARIYGKGRGWVFTQTDFADLGTRQSVDVALHRLLNEGRIRRIARGLYDYPRYSDLLETTLAPDYDLAARAIARRHGWRIQISGSAALNILGLSTQVPGRLTYLSDGPSREFVINENTIEFRHSSLRESCFRMRESSLVVQALRALGPDHVTPDVLDRIGKWLDPALCPKILKDTRTAAGWIHRAIREICEGGARG